MIIAVAERRHLPDLTPATEFSMAQEWLAAPVGSMLEVPALECGPSRTRLDKLTGDFAFDLRVNLLWPTANLGEWDAEAARVCAERLDEVARTWGARLVLLGRRVARAFGFGGVPLCRARERYLVFPHPSGRSRALNDSSSRAAARRAFREFVR